MSGRGPRSVSDRGHPVFCSNFMNPTKAENLYGLQILRGMAAVAVVLQHLCWESKDVLRISQAFTNFGAAGVHLFFALSGFLMLYTNAFHFGKPDAWHTFLKRRIVRIVPLYWLCTALIVSTHWSGKFYRHQTLTSANIVKSLLFCDVEHPVVSVGWTLNYEMYFYVIFAFCLFAITSARFAMPFIGSIMLLNIVVLTRFLPAGFHAMFANPLAFEFVMGMAVAAFYQMFKVSNRLRLLIGCGALACMYLMCVFGQSVDTNVQWVAWGLPSALLLFAVLPMSKPVSGGGQICLLLGDASYSLYLTHPFVMTSYDVVLKRGLLHGWQVWAAMPLVLVVSIIVGVLVHRHVERPILRYLPGRALTRLRRSDEMSGQPIPMIKAAN
jgi:exopolysaccharide production protein ExoZ